MDRIVSILQHEFPDTIEGIQHFVDYHPPVPGVLMNQCAQTATFPRRAIFSSTQQLIAILAAVQRANIRILLPAILLRCAMQETNALCSSAREQGFTPGEVELLQDIPNRLAARAQPQLISMCESFSMACQTEGNCRLRNVDSIRMLFFPFSLTMAGSQWCAGCVSNFWQWMCQGGLKESTRVNRSQQNWESLPGLLGLPPWDRLRKEHKELWDDVDHD